MTCLVSFYDLVNTNQSTLAFCTPTLKIVQMLLILKLSKNYKNPLIATSLGTAKQKETTVARSFFKQECCSYFLKSRFQIMTKSEAKFLTKKQNEQIIPSQDCCCRMAKLENSETVPSSAHKISSMHLRCQNEMPLTEDCTDVQ